MRIFIFFLLACCFFSFSGAREQTDLERWGLKGKVKYITQYTNYSGYDSLTGYPIKECTLYFNRDGNKIWEISYYHNDTFYRDSFLYDSRNRLFEVRRDFYPKLDSNGYRNSYLFYDKAIYVYENNLLASIHHVIPKQYDQPLHDFHFAFRHDKKGKMVEKRDMADTLEISRETYSYPGENIHETRYFQFSRQPYQLRVDSLDKKGSLAESRYYRSRYSQDSLGNAQKNRPMELASIEKFERSNITGRLLYEKDAKIQTTIIEYKHDHKNNWLECTHKISGKLMGRFTQVIEYY
jgi:hypothetical protein